MKSTTERPKTKQLYAAIATALALGASVVMTSHAQEGDIDPVQTPDIDVVLAETPEVEPLPEEIPEIGQLPVETETLTVHPDVAVDNDGYAYDGDAYAGVGPAGLYNAILDKQQKLGMTVTYDAAGYPVDVNYEGSNHGHQTALARLRENLERKLNKLDDGAEVPEVEPLPEEVGGTAVEELAVAAELGVSKRSVKAAKARIDKSQKLEKSVKLEKATRVEKTVRIEKASKPIRAERVERPQKPTKVTRVERPQRPEKISRVEKPQRPEKISRVEKPQRPQKPQKPEKPQRPGRS
ncbi:MAG: hypothetical protein U9N50_08480 [Pseudomonadota bacterium]|nr:hypothetical protein [Pseudomonadota bacterium]